MSSIAATDIDRIVPDLDDPGRRCVALLAELHDATPEQLVERFGVKGLQRAPRGLLKHVRAMTRLEFAGSGVEDGLAWIDLPNDRRFWSWCSRRNHEREFSYVADLLPGITAETYLAAKDVTARYLTDHAWYPSEVLPGRGGVVVEVGAYLGHKSMRFVDECIGPEGRLLAIEILPENVELLERNVRTNGLTDVIDIRQCGVWNAPGTMTVRGKGRQRNSLVNLDKIAAEKPTMRTRLRTLRDAIAPPGKVDPGVAMEVRTEPLDALLEEWDVPFVDFMILTVNGAELQVLEGLDRWWDRVRHLYLAACYTVDGRDTYQPCVDALRARGVEILPCSTKYEIYTRNPNAISPPRDV